MLSDTEMDDLRWKSELIGGVVQVRPEELRQLLDEISRLRAEVARLEAGRLKPETAFELRALLITFPTDVYEAEVDDFFRCYPEEV